ncbi:MAG TPA: glycosyltransferase family protein [Kofleriaceae bacterium]|jgi:spore coat polysaccharide biosynthesis protein SpsF|nr:glycosyltransferase family protein [Kofleriaceae bacterium]
MRVTVVIQARTGSTRLPGKVLLHAAGAPLLERMVERVCAARTPSEIVIATTEATTDDPICGIARRVGVHCVRGHATDCLDRHVAAARATSADAVVKIPSDCPLIDPDTVDRVIGAFLAEPDIDYASNLHPATWPDGFDVEIMTRGALETAWREAARPLDREHTTPFLWDNPERFTTLNVAWQTGLDHSLSHRLVLDYPEDYAVIRAIYDELWSADRTFTLSDILALLDARPALAAVNAMHRGTSWINNHLGELKTLAHGGMP